MVKGMAIALVQRAFLFQSVSLDRDSDVANRRVLVREDVIVEEPGETRRRHRDVGGVDAKREGVRIVERRRATGCIADEGAIERCGFPESRPERREETRCGTTHQPGRSAASRRHRD
jgi:hypothetical protein